MPERTEKLNIIMFCRYLQLNAYICHVDLQTNVTACNALISSTLDIFLSLYMCDSASWDSLSIHHISICTSKRCEGYTLRVHIITGTRFVPTYQPGFALVLAKSCHNVCERWKAYLIPLQILCASVTHLHTSHARHALVTWP